MIKNILGWNGGTGHGKYKGNVQRDTLWNVGFVWPGMKCEGNLLPGQRNFHWPIFSKRRLLSPHSSSFHLQTIQKDDQWKRHYCYHRTISGANVCWVVRGLTFFALFKMLKERNHCIIFPRNCPLTWHHAVFKWYQQSDSEKGTWTKISRK